MQHHNRIIKYIKYILSFFLVLGALFAAGQHRATAYAAGSDRIYYFNMSANGVEGSMILVETDGHWGLMDAGHRYATTIQDSTVRTLSTAVNGLSSQIYCRNGKDVANYMINVLGVRHLDFVIGTHAHSDHIGGIPELAAATYTGKDGQPCHLVDDATTYYYKEYQHISDVEDDLVQYSSASWHNQAFAYQAAEAMRTQGAVLVNVANGRVVTNAEQANFSDYIEFKVGDMTFRLYNLDEQTYSGNENVNSIVTVISNGEHTVVNLADINTNNGAIDRISEAIAGDIANNPNMAPVDIVVAGHHGYAGSNTKTMFDELQPGFVVVSNGMGNSWLYTDGDLAAAIPYAEGLFGTLFYNTSISPYAVVTDLNGDSVYVYSLEGNGDLTNAINRMMKSANKTGWASWVNTDGTLWSYLEKGKSVKNAWRQVDGKWYHFDNTGIMQTGWITVDGKQYFLDNSGAMAAGWLQQDGNWYFLNWNQQSRYGEMLTGLQTIGGKLYDLGTDGVRKTGWVTENGKKYYFDPGTGAAVTGWFQQDGSWYFLNWNKQNRYGEMLTGVQTIGGKQYIFGADGMMQTGWINENGARYYYDPVSGALKTGWLQLDGKWYFLNWNRQNRYGEMLTGLQTIGGTPYVFDDNGVMQTGWVKAANGATYYYDPASGTLKTGWLELNGNKYFLNWNKQNRYGEMLTGWQQIGGVWYCFDLNSGRMLAGEWSPDGYYLKADGRMANSGWQQIGGDWYYFNADGKYAAGWLTLGSGTFYLAPDGKMLTGLQEIDGQTYYFDSQGYLSDLPAPQLRTVKSVADAVNSDEAALNNAENPDLNNGNADNTPELTVDNQEETVESKEEGSEEEQKEPEKDIGEESIEDNLDEAA